MLLAVGSCLEDLHKLLAGLEVKVFERVRIITVGIVVVVVVANLALGTTLLWPISIENENVLQRTYS